MSSKLLYRKNAIFTKVDICNEEKFAMDCCIDGCIYDSLYCCYLCKNYTCFHHANNLGDNKKNGSLYACDICYKNDNLNDVIVATQLHNNKKGVLGEFMEKFVRFISFEWIHHVGFKVKPVG